MLPLEKIDPWLLMFLCRMGAVLTGSPADLLPLQHYNVILRLAGLGAAAGVYKRREVASGSVSAGATVGKPSLTIHAGLRLFGDPAASMSLASCKGAGRGMLFKLHTGGTLPLGCHWSSMQGKCKH